MQLRAIFFIIPWKALYMFRVLFAPIIRSVLKLYVQLLVQSCIGMVSDPVCYKKIRSRKSCIGMVSDPVCYKMIRSRERACLLPTSDHLVTDWM
jgi:hypothetical protein